MMLKLKKMTMMMKKKMKMWTGPWHIFSRKERQRKVHDLDGACNVHGSNRKSKYQIFKVYVFR